MGGIRGNGLLPCSGHCSPTPSARHDGQLRKAAQSSGVAAQVIVRAHRPAFPGPTCTVPPAARAMAVQLCGERRVVSARATLASLADAQSTPTPLRLAARHALDILVNGDNVL